MMPASADVGTMRDGRESALFRTSLRYSSGELDLALSCKSGNIPRRGNALRRPTRIVVDGTWERSAKGLRRGPGPWTVLFGSDPPRRPRLMTDAVKPRKRRWL